MSDVEAETDPGQDPSPTDDALREGRRDRAGALRPEEQVAAADMKRRLFPSLAGDADAPARIGPFTVGRKLGAGGAGTVYAARDPRLDRHVAIKLLHRPGDRSARERLAREARMLANVEHDNVVAVYDVGAHEGGTYVVMELVNGPTLAAWIRSERPWREIVAMFVAAGRGLAAAHAAGVMHRDFKPANVLIDRAGVPKVADFGLARADETRSGPGEEAPVAFDTVGATLTRSGTVLGTPAYMAPEQHRGEATDERADQYAFCVSLFQALSGRKPFAGGTLEALAAAKERPPRLPGEARVPEAIRAIIDRGLRPKPEDRFEDMNALLTALEQAAKRSSRPAWVGAGVLVVALAGALLVPGEDVPADDPCATQVGVAVARWREQPPAPPRTQAVLDAWIDDYRARRVDACAGTDPAIVACLDAGAEELEALLVALQGDDASPYGLVAARSLPDPGECSASSPATVLPRSVRAAVAASRAQMGAGAFEAALAALDGLDEAELADDARAAIAVERARVHLATGRYDDAAAAVARVGTDAPPALLAEAALVDAEVVLWRDAAYAEAKAALDRAANHIDALDRGADLRARAMWLEGRLRLSAGEPKVAVEVLRRAVESLGALGPRRAAERAQARASLGRALGELGELDEADATLATALEEWRDAAGDGHPGQGSVLSAMAHVAMLRNDDEQALDLQRRATEAWRGYPPGHATQVLAELRLGVLLFTAKHLPEARTQFERALAQARESLPPDHPQVVAARGNLGAVLLRSGDAEAALAEFRELLTLARHRHGDRHIDVGRLHINIAQSLLALHRGGEAVTEATAGVDILDAAPAEPLMRARSHFILAESLAAATRPMQAREEAKRARTIYTEAGPGGEPGTRAIDRWLADH